jgi:putative transposase
MNHRFKNQRKSIRLEGYDYSSSGAYFVTICANVKGFDWFGVLSRDSVVLNDAGKMIESELHNLPKRFSSLELDTHIVMPDHIHAILVLSDLPNANAKGRGELHVRPAQPAQQLSTTQPKHQTSTRFDLPITQSVTGEHTVRPYEHPNGTKVDSVSRMVQLFKTFTTQEYIRGVRQLGRRPFEKRFWERNYFERVLRNETELEEKRQYILNNPIRALEKKGVL